jgi:NAD(P)-dependent dehydrogenase (short-subunit alcohol dehydrogenase family)
MRDLSGKTAVVTGGASGIGNALVERFVREGMRVVIADVEATALNAAADRLRRSGAEVTGVVTDVTRYESVQALAQRAAEAYGPVHVLCNNAGVGAHEDVPLWELPLSDWRWTFNVNVWGVIHGIKAFVPAMLAHGEAGHVINTSSGNGGLILLPFTPIYSTSKSAVSALTEVLHFQLSQLGAKIRASVLYPGPNVVATNIFTASRNRSADYTREVPQATPPITLDGLREMFGGKLEVTQPADVAEYAIEGIRADAFFLLPPNERTDEGVRQRADAVLRRRDPQPPSFF